MIEVSIVKKTIDTFIEIFAQQENLRVARDPIYYNLEKQYSSPGLKRNLQQAQSVMIDDSALQMRLSICFDEETLQLIYWRFHRDINHKWISISIADVKSVAQDTLVRYVPDDIDRSKFLLQQPVIKLIESL